jgi:hypothetical protein
LIINFTTDAREFWLMVRRGDGVRMTVDSVQRVLDCQASFNLKRAWWFKSSLANGLDYVAIEREIGNPLILITEAHDTQQQYRHPYHLILCTPLRPRQVFDENTITWRQEGF